jgi:predicted TIM-barrel fold metal-dependent hydrolase
MLFAYAEAGAKGFGEHKPGVPIDDLRSMDLYWACGEVGLPVLFHLDNQRNTDDIELSGLEKALRENEKTIFIGHGPGWWASIAGGNKQSDLGGYPKGEVAPGGAIDRLMEAYPNVYGDLSAGSGANAISRDPDFGPAFVARRADRLMFGTDFLAPGQEVSQFEVLTGMELPADVEAKVFRDNARRVLGLD